MLPDPSEPVKTHHLATENRKTANAFIKLRATAVSRTKLRKTVRMLVSRFRRDALSRALLSWSGEAARARQEEELNDVIAKTREQHSRTLQVVKATRERREFDRTLVRRGAGRQGWRREGRD